jgi:hypothetical protein
MHGCVMCVKGQRVINCPFPSLLACLRSHWSWCSLMFGVSLLFLLDDSSIMCRLSMNTASLHDSIFSNISLKFSASFMISNNLLKHGLIEKILLCRQIGEVSIKNSLLSFNRWELLTMFYIHILTSRMALPSINTAI